MFSFPADNIHPEENPCFCSIIENYDVNTKLMFFWHFIPFSDIIIMVYSCFWEVIKSHEWNNKIIFCVRMSSWDFLGFWIHLQMPRSPGNRVAFFYVFNYVCTSKNLAIAFWKEGGERDIWQKAFTFVLSFSKEIFPLASPCFTVKQENLCTTTMQFLNAICSMGFLSSSDNLKLSLFPKMQQQNQGISMQYLYTSQYLTEFSNVFWTSSERIVQTFFLQEAARSQWQSRHLCPHFWFRSGIKKTIAPIVVTNDSKISFWAKTESQKWHFYDRRRRYHCFSPHHQYFHEHLAESEAGKLGN